MRAVFRVLAIAAVVASAPAAAAPRTLDVPAGTYVLDRPHGSLVWRVNHLGFSNYTARFTAWTATVVLDPADVARSTVTASIDTNSVRTDFPFPEQEDFDKVIATKFLKSASFPAISFRSTALVPTGPDSGRLTGDLTLLGVTRPVTLDVRLNAARMHPVKKAPALGVSIAGSFKRSEFGSADLQGMIGDEVQVVIEAELIKK